MCSLSHKGEVNSVAISPDLSTFLGADSKGTVSVWAPRQPKALATIVCGHSSEVRPRSDPFNPFAAHPDALVPMLGGGGVCGCPGVGVGWGGVLGAAEGRTTEL